MQNDAKANKNNFNNNAGRREISCRYAKRWRKMVHNVLSETKLFEKLMNGWKSLYKIIFVKNQWINGISFRVINFNYVSIKINPLEQQLANGRQALQSCNLFFPVHWYLPQWQNGGFNERWRECPPTKIHIITKTESQHVVNENLW